FILQPYVSQEGSKRYKATGDAIFQNMTLLRRGEEDYILIGSGDHIYKIDFSRVFDFHLSNDADITLLVKELDDTYNLSQYGIVELSGNRITNIEEKPQKPKTNIGFLGIYFMNKYLLMELLYNYVTKGETDLLSIVTSQLDRLRVCGYLFNGYWRNVKKGIDEYFRINMDGLKKEVREELFYKHGKIYTKLKDLPPPKIGSAAVVKNSILSDGCIVNGSVENSILFRGVYVKAGAAIENSVVMQDTVIEEGAIVKNAILDKEVLIRQESRLVGRDSIAILEKRAVL
ncbi:MAG: glucose-1-phosphate adenylyltransferase family protein, partial [Pseudothermotoga sp.]